MAVNFNNVFEKTQNNAMECAKSILERNMENVNVEKILENALSCAREFHFILDYSRTSITHLDMLLSYYGKMVTSKEQIEQGALMFGIYLGETMLKNALQEHGFKWGFEENQEMPCLVDDNNNYFYPIERVHKKICRTTDNISVYYVKTHMWGNEDVDFSNIRNI